MLTKKTSNIRNILALLSLGLIVFLTHTADAAMITVIDQQNVGTTIGVTLVTVGQSFTPTLPKIDAAEFSIQTFGQISSVRLDVLEGNGFNGAVLGSSSPVNVFGTEPSFFHFDLNSPVALVPGNPYTLRLQSLDTTFFVHASTIDSYAGGTRYGASGLVEAGDLTFTEGVHAIPEPSSIALCASVLGITSLVRRRKTNVP
ncbi:MAG: PEP-CTERM sorting domain-containing protein [Pirellulaceae bacterium]|nr:PEP-CTERM sorting domain-containing protein [Pirellulaceae bacterium]